MLRSSRLAAKDKGIAAAKQAAAYKATGLDASELKLALSLDGFTPNEIAYALAHAHRSLVIHRDIKPSNILVRRSDGRPKLLDFGIAKLYGEAQDRELTQQGFGPMTPTYAAPEQFRAQPVTVATDIYQFGVLMYRLLSGGLPYDTPTDDPVAWARAVLEHDPLALDRARLRRSAAASAQASPVSRRGLRDLDAIVQKALKKDPAERYGAMLALIVILMAFPSLALWLPELFMGKT